MKTNLLNLRRILFATIMLLGVGVTVWGATETPGNTGTSNNDIVGTSYTIPGSVVAGAGGVKIGTMSTKGVKFRLNTSVGGHSNSIAINVNSGYVITDVVLDGVTNDNTKTAAVGAAYVDGEEVSFTPVTLPNKSGTVSAQFGVSGVEATTSVIFSFSDVTASQAAIDVKVTYKAASTDPDPVVSNIAYAELKGADNSANPTTYTEGTGVAAFEPLADVTGWHFTGWSPASISTTATGDQTITAQWEEVTPGPGPEGDDIIIYQWNTVGTTTYGGSVVGNETVKVKNVATAAIKFPGSLSETNYLMIESNNGGFKEGDVVTFTGVINNSNSAKEGAIMIRSNSATGTIQLATSDKFNNTYDTSVEPTTSSFTLTGNATSLYIGRTNSGLTNATTTWLTDLKVTRKDDGRTIVGTEVAVIGAKVDGVALAGEELTSFLANRTLTLAEQEAEPVVKFVKQTTTNYNIGDPDIETADVTASINLVDNIYVATATINEIVYTINVPKAAAAQSSEKKLTQVVFSNSFDAFINETAKTVTAYYLAGTTAPTVTTTAQSEKATANVDGNTITVTAENASSQDYTIVLAEVTPAAIGEYTFDGTETWVKTGYSFDIENNRGWRFSKNADDGRIQEGKTRQYYFVAACEKFVLHTASGISSDRNIFVYVNGVKVDAITKAPKYNAEGSYIEIPCNTENAVMVAIVSNQTGGDGGFGKAEVKAFEATCPASVAITGTKAYGIGETIELTSTQTGSNTPENVTYQWYKDEVAIDGATAAIFTKAGATAEDAGSYVCKVNQGECAEVASEAYAITVSAIEATSFTIASDLGGLSEIKAGTTFQVTITITPDNTTDKTVTWRSELTSGNPYFTMTEGNPTTVTAVLPCSSAKKVYAKVGSLSEKNISVKVYYEVEFANCDAIESMKYYGNGIDLPTPTGGNEPFVGWYDNAEFTGSAIKLTGYKPAGNVTLYAKWTMPDAETPVITTQPQGKEYEYGTTIFDALTIVAAPATSYQWYKNSAAIDGATEDNYTPTEEGTYYVMVTNHEAGHNDVTIKSDNAVISVAAPAEGYTQVDVTKSTTWDWANAGASVDKGASASGLLANESGITNDETFNSQALNYVGRYPNRSGYFQGRTISLRTTVPGVISVQFSNTGGNAARTASINGNYDKSISSATGSEKVIYTTYVAAGDITISGIQVSNEEGADLRIYKIEFIAEIENSTLRTLTNNQAGTICLTKNAVNLSGASFWKLVEKNGTSVICEEVHVLEAGKGYIYVPEAGATEITGVLYGEAVDDPVPAADNNGLQGTFTEIAAAEHNALEGNYLLYNNKIVQCGGYCSLAAYRAYIVLEDVPTEAPAKAPGVRRMSIPNANAPQTPTAIDNLTEDGVAARKVMVEGNLYIIREGKTYNANGQIVK